jgi:hypothetical protein
MFRTRVFLSPLGSAFHTLKAVKMFMRENKLALPKTHCCRAKKMSTSVAFCSFQLRVPTHPPTKKGGGGQCFLSLALIKKGASRRCEILLMVVLSNLIDEIRLCAVLEADEKG